VALLFSDLGIDASHSRPRVSNDNPFSESQCRTLKYRPECPDRFGALEHARGVSRDLFAWYNDAHHHSGLSYLTPADVHYGRAAAILDVRHRPSPSRLTWFRVDHQFELRRLLDGQVAGLGALEIPVNVDRRAAG
jgi:hypothetical protein